MQLTSLIALEPEFQQEIWELFPFAVTSSIWCNIKYNFRCECVHMLELLLCSLPFTVTWVGKLEMALCQHLMGAAPNC